MKPKTKWKPEEGENIISSTSQMHEIIVLPYLLKMTY